MKKIIFLVCACFFLCTYSTKAQTDTTELTTDSLDNAIAEWKYKFSALDKTKLSTGMLEESSIFPTSIRNYNGKNDSIINMGLIRSFHSQCNSMVLDSTKALLTFDSIENRSTYYRSRGINPIVILDYAYNTFHDSAFAWNLIDSSNNHYVDVAGKSQSPYITQNVFAISPFCFSMGRDTTVSFYIGSDMYLGNNPRMLDSLSIDFGNGWQTLSSGTISYNFPGFGVFDIGIKYTLTNGTEFRTKFKISVTQSITDLPGKNFHYGDIEADISYNGVKKAKGVYVYRMGMGNTSDCFKKPFIITDGVDFGYGMDKAYGWEHCRDGKCNATGFIDIYTGKDHNYESGLKDESLPEFAKGSKLFDDLYREGYDVIFLDFEAGAGYMQANAMLLIKLIDSVNHNKCSKEELVVCGPSMGGQIMRYALSYMETHNLKHCVRTAIYFDSPNKGANIPIGMQLWLKYFTDHNTDNLFDAATVAINQKLDRVATRQLLNNHFSQYDHQKAGERDVFMNDLVYNLGSFPQNIRQVAIPNGSCNNVWDCFSDGITLVNLKIPFKHGHHTIRGVAYATPGNVNKENRIFYGDAMGGNNLVKLNWLAERPLFDNAPGSRNDALKAMEQIAQVMNSRFKYAAVIAPYKVSTFITTNSGLCLTSGDLSYNVEYEMLDEHAPDRSKYQFDAYYKHRGNEIHVEMTDGGIDWIILELQRTRNILFNLPTTYSYWGTDNQNHSVQSSSFNFGNHFRHILNDVQINSGGTLSVNANKGVNYGLTNDYYNSDSSKFTSQYFYLNTANCGSEVEINNGGKFSIGDNNTPTPNKGVVNIKEGSNLYLHSGSNLYIYYGSKLIIEKGATLFVDPGATIYIEDNASIEIKGQLNLSNNTVFKHDGSGKVIFNNTDATFSISATSGSSIEFKSTTDETKLEVSGLITIPSTLSNFKVEGAIVVANNGAKFNIYSPVYFYNGVFKPSASNINNNWEGLKFNDQTDNQIYINKTKFYYATSTALDFSSDYALTSPSFYANEFYNNGVAISINDAGFSINNCTFTDNTKAINANWITQSSLLQGSIFKNNSKGLDYHGNQNAALLLKNNNFTTSDIYIAAAANYPMLVSMRCNKFSSTEIDIDYASLNLSSTTQHTTTEYGGYNTFSSSILAVYQINYLNLKDGYNDFISNGYYITGSIKNSNNMSSSQFTTNYFDKITGVSFPLPNGIGFNYYLGKLDITYINANTQVSSNFKLYGNLTSQKNGGCQAGGGGFAPRIAENNHTETSTISKLYPNPANDILYIEFPTTEYLAQIKVIDMQGRIIVSAQVAAGTSLYTIPVKELQAGMYMVTLDRDGVIEKLKFVKQ